jgi:predicted DNA-binding protein (UPF0251 family)
MSVTVDHQPLETDQLGLQTVGQVLSHLQRGGDRLIVKVLIDGQQPDLSHLAQLRRAPVTGHTVYIETAEPRQLALEVLGEVERQITDAEALKTEAIQLLQTNQATRAMEKLNACFTAWHGAQDAVTKIAQLLRLDLSQISAGEHPFDVVLIEFAEHLKRIRAALEDRDYVSLSDTLAYETKDVAPQWRAAIAGIRATLK